jgi:hypothetical protein
MKIAIRNLRAHMSSARYGTDSFAASEGAVASKLRKNSHCRGCEDKIEQLRLRIESLITQGSGKERAAIETGAALSPLQPVDY